MIRSFLITAASVAGAFVVFTSLAAGQGIVVQQPEFHFTTAATTVLVPDRGEVLLGGIQRGQDSRSQFGVPILGQIPVLGRPFNNVGISRSRGASTISVRAYIHDFEAMDEAILAEAARRRGGAPSESFTRMSHDQGVRSLAAIERQRDAEEDAQRFEADNLLAKARACEAKGRSGVAKLFYKMAAKEAKDPRVKAMALERIAALSKPASNSKLAASGK